MSVDTLSRYGIELTEDHLRDVRAISDENGEVNASPGCRLASNKDQILLFFRCAKMTLSST